MTTLMDRSPGGFVVWCTDCPSWRDHFSTELNAVLARCKHESLTHNNPHGAGHMKLKHMRADDRNNVEVDLRRSPV